MTGKTTKMTITLFSSMFLIFVLGCAEVKKEMKRQEEGVKANRELQDAFQKYQRAIDKKTRDELLGRRTDEADRQIEAASRELHKAHEKLRRIGEKRGREFRK